MSRLILTLTALLLATAAQAQDSITVFVRSGTPEAKARVIAAAEQVCKTAIRHGVMNDFGSLDECVANTVAGVISRPVSEMHAAR